MLTLALISIFLIGGSVSQEDPWPPLTSTCDVMPLIAADANKFGQGKIACASTSWPNCETINCDVTSNHDQLELQLLPCWQHPAMWFKVRPISGGNGTTFQEIFDSSKVVNASIGGKELMLNVTVIQRDGLTLGFGIDVLLPGKVMKIFPYRDIPLNQTECPGTGMPLMCKMILYMEQYIITSYSGRIDNPLMTPTCKLPKTDSCRSMSCMWKSSQWNTYGAIVYHDYELLPCSKPQAVRLIVFVGEAVVNTTFYNSQVVFLNETSKLNFTLKHIREQTIGIQVDFIYSDKGVITEIPYTELPMETSGCPSPPSPPPRYLERGRLSSSHRAISLYKQRLSATPPPRSPNNSSPPLISTCDIIPRMVDSINSEPSHFLTCHVSPPPNDGMRRPCNQINCTVVGTGDRFMVNLSPCTSPPALHFIVTSSNLSTVMSNVSVSANGSTRVNFNITSNSFPMTFTIVQHTGYLTMGLSVVASLNETANATVIPYNEIPIMCPGETTPPSPTCAAMRDVAQYLNIYFYNRTKDITNPWDCSLLNDCSNVTCSMAPDVYHSIAISPCNQALTILSYDGFNYTFVKSGMVYIGNGSILNLVISHNASRGTLGIEISEVTTDSSNNNTLAVPIVPYIDIPLNSTTCSLPRSDSDPLVTMCDLMPHIAAEVTANQSNGLQCINFPLPTDCSKIFCHISSDDRNVSVQVHPCANPPAVELVVTGSNQTTHSFNSSGSFMVSTGVFRVFMVHHPHQLTLGIGVYYYNSTTSIEESTPVEIMPYHEVPLNTNSCPREPHKTLTCQVMDSVVQYLNVYIANQTHSPSYCEATRASFCNNISCFNDPRLPSNGGFNMSFLPCGDMIGFHSADGNITNPGYNFITYTSILFNYTENISGNITLVQLNETEVSFGVQLFVDHIYRGDEVPLVNIPLDKTICEPNPPQNHTHNNHTYSSTCNIMSLLADAATNAIPDTLNCTSSPPNCYQVDCMTLTHSNHLIFRILPCYNPPALRMVTQDAQGNVGFSRTFTSSASSVAANIGLNLAVLNITIIRHIQHTEKLTLGLMINASIIDGNGNNVTVPLVPYREIPINRTACSSATNDTATCMVMDEVAQHLTVFLGNLTHKPEDTPECRALRQSLCNTLYCTLPENSGHYNITFLPCSNPSGVTSYSIDYRNNSMTNNTFTLYNSAMVAINQAANVTVTLDHLDSNTVGFEVILNQLTPTMNNLTEIPYTRIPLNTSRCPAHHGNGNDSLISTCDIFPAIAREASTALDNGGSLMCTSSGIDCNTIQCLVLGSGEEINLTLHPCTDPPALVFRSTSTQNGDTSPLTKNLTASEMIELSIGDRPVPLYINIMQHRSRLSIGLEVIASVLTPDASVPANVTLVQYKEIPIDRSACSTPVFPISHCDVMNNISQYVNFIFSNASSHSVDCFSSGTCDKMTCIYGRNESSFSFTLIPCKVPPAVMIVTSSNGTVGFNETVTDSGIVQWDNFSSLNVTILHFNSTMIGLKVGLLSLNSTDSLNLIPMVRIPLNASGCSSAPPTIRNTTLVNTCQVMSLVAKSTSPIDIDDIQCNSSRSPNCTTISCTVPRTDDAITFEFEPCIFNPPAIAVRNSVNGQVRQQHNIEETTTFNNFVLGGKTVSLTVTLVEHSMVKSIGFKVDISVSNSSSSREFIPYREIPFDPSKCPHAPRLSPTCRTMTNIAQYMMFFIANSTLSMEDTPDCHPDRKLLCNSIDCIMPGSSHAYKGTFLVCQDPVAFQVVHTFDGDVVEDTTYTLSSLIGLKDGVSAQMTLDNLDNHTVQFRIYQETLGGDLVPSVKVPLDNRSCRPTPPVTTAAPSSSETTGTGGTDEPDSVPSLLLIEIAAPIGVISILVILALTIVICTLCFKQKKLSNDPYSFKPLTDQEAVEDAENGDN